MSTFQSRSIFQNTYRSDIVRLLLICGGFYVSLSLAERLYEMSVGNNLAYYKNVLYPLSLPASLADLMHQPWSILTFGFIETSFWALMSNMVWLWVFGTIIEDLTGTNRVLPLFWVGSIVGGIVYLILSSFLPLPQFLYYGTMGGVAAVAVAAITFQPRYVFYALFGRGVPIYVFGLIFLGLTILFKLNNLPSLIFFVSGGSVGFMYHNFLHRFFEWINKNLASLRTYFSSNSNFIKCKKPTFVSQTAHPIRDNMALEIDAILDKINTKGIGSISQKEKDFLKKYGEG